MNDFMYYNPVRVHFGADAMSHLPEELGKFGANVLLTYGGGSIKRTGLYDRVLDALRAAGEITAATFQRLAEAIKPGVSTAELDDIAARFIKKQHATCSFWMYNGYPAHICTSINDQVVHGIPSPHIELKEGDIISINIPENRLDMKVSDEVLAERRAKWQPREPKVTTGYLARYREMVTSGNRGAVLEIKK